MSRKAKGSLSIEIELPPTKDILETFQMFKDLCMGEDRDPVRWARYAGYGGA